MWCLFVSMFKPNKTKQYQFCYKCPAYIGNEDKQFSEGKQCILNQKVCFDIFYRLKPVGKCFSPNTYKEYIRLLKSINKTNRRFAVV